MVRFAVDVHAAFATYDIAFGDLKRPNQHALNLNQALLQTNAVTPVETMHSFIHCTVPNVTLEAVKRSEDGKDMIVRIVERHNSLTKAVLSFDRPIKEAWRCDMMENIEAAVQPQGHEMPVVLRPYGILTLRIAF
jgi:alpha-mannosidase